MEACITFSRELSPIKDIFHFLKLKDRVEDILFLFQAKAYGLILKGLFILFQNMGMNILLKVFLFMSTEKLLALEEKLMCMMSKQGILTRKLI